MQNLHLCFHILFPVLHVKTNMAFHVDIICSPISCNMQRDHGQEWISAFSCGWGVQNYTNFEHLKLYNYIDW